MSSRFLSFLFQFLVHSGCRGFIGRLVDLRDLHLQRALAKSDLDDIAHLHLLAGLDLPAIDADPLPVTGLVGHAAALDQAGYL